MKCLRGYEHIEGHFIQEAEYFKSGPQKGRSKRWVDYWVTPKNEAFNEHRVLVLTHKTPDEKIFYSCPQCGTLRLGDECG